VTDPSPGEPLAVATASGVAVVTIDHPPTNLVDGAFIGALMRVLGELEDDDTVKVAVFESADPDFFLMHGDVDGILAMPQGEAPVVVEPNVAAATFQRLSTCRLLTIGAIDGAARGGGAEFLLALDVRIGSPRTVVGQPEVAMGILPGAGGTARLPHVVGRSRALDLLLTGRDIDAAEALEMGWLDAVVPSAQVREYALAQAVKVATMPAASIASIKHVVNTSLQRGLAAGLVAETDAFGQLVSFGSHEARMRRFLAAGGQTREGETTRMDEIMTATSEEG
jgi:enoyl-CoA hydratase/carnithine racemase